MKAHQGDRIILAARHTDEPTRQGEVLEVRGANGEPPYLVRWADGHTGLMYPGPGSILRVEGEHVAMCQQEPPYPEPADRPKKWSSQRFLMCVNGKCGCRSSSPGTTQALTSSCSPRRRLT